MAAGFVTGMLAGARRRGLDPRGLLQGAGMAPARLADPAARVPLADYVALYNALVRELEDEGFALFSRPLPPGTFEFLCRAMAAPGSLGDALDRGARFLALVLPDLSVSLTRRGALARLEIAERRRLAPRRADPGRVFAFEWLLRLLHGLASWLAGRGIALASVQFPFPRPAHAADYALVYTERSGFGAAHLVATLDAALLDLPVVRGASDVPAFLEGSPGRISMLYRRDREIVRRVREHVAANLAANPSLAQAALALAVSPRTLHRRLRDEGTSFRALKDALRRDLALEALARRHASIGRVASDLGYAEPSAFFRAFRAWTGEAPSTHRKRAGASR